jgi:hypothetical protein
MKPHFKDFSCSEFFSKIPKEKVFLEQVHKSDKYSSESGMAFEIKTYILFLYDYFKCHVSKLVILS